MTTALRSNLMNLRFTRYASPVNESLGFAAVEEEAEKDGLLYARAEDSGCEGCYVEVARWSEERNRWERAYHCKLFGGADVSPDLEELSDEDACRLVANAINSAGSDWRVSDGRDVMKMVGGLPDADDPVGVKPTLRGDITLRPTSVEAFAPDGMGGRERLSHFTDGDPDRTTKAIGRVVEWLIRHGRHSFDIRVESVDD